MIFNYFSQIYYGAALRRLALFSATVMLAMTAGVLSPQSRIVHASGSAIIQGYKTPTDQAGPASATILIGGAFGTTANPYNYSTTAGTYTVRATVPQGWQLLGYTLCYDSTDCHNNVPTPGSSVTVYAADGGYVDLYWHYAPVVQAPAPKPAPTPAPATPPVIRPSQTPSPASTPPAPDTEAPSKPGNLVARLDSDGTTALLSWDASTDNTGVTGYTVERSIDQNKWDSLSQGAVATSYSDKTTTYSLHYFYRVKATDAAGNVSQYAVTDVTTNAFNANSGKDQPTSIHSDDGLLTAQIPASAMDAAAQCSLTQEDQNKASIATTGLALTAGPYRLTCKKSDGSIIDSFNSDVTLSVPLSSKSFNSYSNLKLYQYDAGSGRWVLLSAVLNQKTHVLSVTVRNPVQVAVLGTPKTGVSANLIAIIILPLLFMSVFIVWAVRKQRKEQYQEYIRRKYYNL